jgi:uncharacterized protein YbjT (DUF2867 family)
MNFGLRRLAVAISLYALSFTAIGFAAEPTGALARTVLVVGATGRTGRAAVEQSLAAGYQVRALVRDEARARAALGDTVTFIVGDVRTGEGISKAVDGVDFIISALGSNVRNDPSNTPELVDYGGVRRLTEAAAKAKVRHFVLVSSMGATHRDHPLNRMYSNILTWKLKGEDALRASGVPYTIVRPGGLTEAAGGEFLPMMMQGDDLSRQGRIARADVAAIAVAALNRPEAFQKTFEVVASNATGAPNWALLFGGLKVDEK